MNTARTRLQIIQADITTLSCDAIVNAANSSLLGGGGVDGAIHRAAGPELVMACRRLHGCKTGDAKITPGFHLPARHVIHTVGPVWNGGGLNEDDELASCYRRSCAVAREHELRSLAFPCIATGIYGFPIERAARIAVTVLLDELNQHPQLEVTCCCFSPDDYAIYQHSVDELKI